LIKLFLGLSDLFKDSGKTQDWQYVSIHITDILAPSLFSIRNNELELEELELESLDVLLEELSELELDEDELVESESESDGEGSE